MDTTYRKNLKAVLTASKNYTDKEIKKVYSDFGRNNITTEDHINELTYQITAPAGAKLLQLQAIGGNSVKYAPSVASDDSVAKDKVIPEYTYDSQLNYIGGASKVSENLEVLDDVAVIDTGNGITYKIENGGITLNGTATANTTIDLTGRTTWLQDLNGNYSYGLFNASADFGATIQYFIEYQSSSNRAYFINGSSATANKSGTFNVAWTKPTAHIIYIVSGATFTNFQLKPMLVSGSTAPTEFSEGFENIRSAKTTSVVVSDTDVAPITKAIPAEILANEYYGLGYDDTHYNKLDLITKNIYADWKQYTIDGSILYQNTSWSSETNISTYTELPNSVNQSTTLKIDRNFGISANGGNSATTDQVRIASGNVIYINFTSNGGKISELTLAKAKEWLSNNPLTILYNMATQVVVDVSQYIGDDFKKFALDNNYTNVELINEYNYDIPNKLEYYGTIKETLCPSVTVEGANKLNITDVAQTTTNGITYKVENGVITLISGTATSGVKIATTSINVVSGMSLGAFNSAGMNGLIVQLRNNEVWVEDIYLNAINKTGTFTNSGNSINIGVASGTTISSPITIKPMLVSGSTAPTTFRPYKDTITRALPTQASDGYGVNANAHNLRVFSDYEGNAVSKRYTNVSKELIGSLTGGYDSSRPRFYLYTINFKPNNVITMTSSRYTANAGVFDNPATTDLLMGTGADGTTFTTDFAYSDFTTYKNANADVALYSELKDTSKTETDMDDFDFFFDVEEGDVITFNNPYAQQVYATYSFIIKEAKSNE